MPSINPGSIVIIHLANPTEKLWGLLEEVALQGIYLRALNVSTFEDWMAQASRDEPQTLGLATLFVPLFRLEKMFLDETVGTVESFQERFYKRVGLSVERYLGLDTGEEGGGWPLPS